MITFRLQVAGRDVGPQFMDTVDERRSLEALRAHEWAARHYPGEPYSIVIRRAGSIDRRVACHPPCDAAATGTTVPPAATSRRG